MERNTDTHGTAPNGPATPTAMGDAAHLADTASAETGGRVRARVPSYPVLLGQGRHLFDHLAAEHIELARTRILEGENGVTHIHYRVQR